MRTWIRLLPDAAGCLLLALVAGCSQAPGDSKAEGGDTALPAAAPDAPASPAPVEDVGNSAKRAFADPAPTVTVEADATPDHPLDLPPSNDAAPAETFPDEVTAFMVDRDGCDHFRGEEPYDAERRAYIQENITELCRGTDEKLALLRQRYANDRAVLAALSGYEAKVEPGPRP